MSNVSTMPFFGTQTLTDCSFARGGCTMPLHGFGGFGGFGLGGGMQGGLLDMLRGLAQALQGLSDMIGGQGGQGRNGGINPAPFPFMPGNGGGSAPFAPGPQQKIAGTARIWGDPHFIGADGGKFDVQGQAGKTYNLLSDKSFQMNGKFEQWGGDKGATVVGEVGITATGNTIHIDKTGKAVVNGRVLKDGEHVHLKDGGTVEKKGSEIIVKKGEWEVNFQTQGDHINMDIKTDNAIADGVRPHGLIGQTFDGDGKARNGDQGSGTQGGGAIEDANGRITRAGDKSAVKSYEVDGLYDNTFLTHNRDFGGMGYQYDATLREMNQLAMFSGYQMLTASLSSMGNGFGSNFGNGFGSFGLMDGPWSKPTWA